VTAAPSVKPPVALGCTLAAAAFVVAIVIALTFVVFLESGSDHGALTLDPAASYEPGTVTRVAEEGLYIVRLEDEFFALDDLDAANRASEGARCRVAPLAPSDPALPAILDEFGDVISPAAGGSTLVFREDCNGALYDATGARLDAAGPALTRYRTTIDQAGRLVVDTTRPLCPGGRSDAPPSCP
jgi:hypothetical protein